ncbi:MAG: outer membrane protein assembly factor BamB [Pseudomonadales bacterium]|nr:outer membrane protein assembly factor BamB [Pseudomonadales bacterium]
MNRLLLPLLTILLVLAGCSSSEIKELEPAELQDLEHSVELKELWDFNLGDLREHDATRLQPTIDGGQLFVVDAEGDLYSLNKTTGERNWVVELGKNITAGVSAADRKLAVGTDKGEVLLLAQSDGSVLWSVTLTEEILSLPQIRDDLMVVQTTGGRFYGLELSDGARRWVYEITLPSLTVRGTASPINLGEVSIAGFSTGKIAVIDNEKGGLIWEKPVSLPKGKTELERVIDIDSTPLLRNDVIYAASYQGHVSAFRLYTSKKIWSKPVSSLKDLAWGGTQLFVTDDRSEIHALEPASGASLWVQTALHHRRLTAPTVWKDNLLVADLEGYIHIVSQATGRIIGRERPVSGSVGSPIVVSDDVIYVISDSGQLIALTQE